MLAKPWRERVELLVVHGDPRPAQGGGIFVAARTVNLEVI